MFEELKINFESSGSRVEIVDLSHNSALNCLFLLTNAKRLFVYDCNTHVLLKHIDLADDPIKILNSNDKCLVLSDQKLGMRTAHDGIFLLESVFQTKFKTLNESNEFFLEFTLNDSIILLNALKGIDYDSINGLDVLVKQINHQVASPNGKYDQQVSSFCFRSHHGTRSVRNSIELVANNQNHVDI
jgi:hypothetical protein